MSQHKIIKNLKTFIIFGGHGYNTQGVIECMATNNMDFFLLLVKGSRVYSVTLKSKYVTRYKEVNSIEEGVKYLLEHKTDFDGSVIYPTSDAAESVLDLNYDQLITNYCFPNAGKQGAVTSLMNKYIQYQYAKKAGLDVPDFMKVSLENFAGVSYPCIVKPQESINGSKEDIAICHDEEQLKKVLAGAKYTKNFIAQEYIQKDYDILLIGCKMPNGGIMIPGCFKKDRWCPFGGDGSYGEISTFVDDYFNKMQELKVFINSIGYVGPFSVELGHTNNKNYFFEINLRNDGTSNYFYKAGIYIPYFFYQECLKNKYSISIIKTKYKFIDEFSDFYNILLGKLSLLNWVKDLITAKAYKYYHPQDKKVFLELMPRKIFADLYHLLRVILKKERKQ